MIRIYQNKYQYEISFNNIYTSVYQFQIKLSSSSSSSSSLWACYSRAVAQVGIMQCAFFFNPH